MIKVFRSPKCSSCIEGGELEGSCCFEFLWELGVEVRPRQASVLRVFVLAGTNEGTSEFKSYNVNSL